MINVFEILKSVCTMYKAIEFIYGINVKYNVTRVISET